MSYRAGMRFAAAFAFCLGCASPTPTPPVAPTDDAPPLVPTKIDLDRADAFEVLATAEQLLQESVLVEALALAPLRCIAVTVKEPQPLPQREAAAKLLDALRAQGL